MAKKKTVSSQVTLSRMQALIFVLVFALVGTYAIWATFAQSPNKKGACSISPNPAAVSQNFVISASGIPVGGAVNILTTSPSGVTTGSPLGSTPDGNFNLNNSEASSGLWQYQFTGPTKVRNTVIYATCSVQVN